MPLTFLFRFEVVPVVHNLRQQLWNQCPQRFYVDVLSPLVKVFLHTYHFFVVNFCKKYTFVMLNIFSHKDQFPIHFYCNLLEKVYTVLPLF